MPGKRTRKDSNCSTGSAGAASSSGSSEAVPCRGAESSSSGSVDDEHENVAMKPCCFPVGCLFGEDTVSEENTMVKVICSHDACSMSQFMHKECFNHWEESLLNCLRSYGRARSWTEKQRRQNLWTKKGYDLVYRACVCKCKHGHLRKDLNWMPEASLPASEQDTAASKKKNRKKHRDLPSLGGFNGLVRTKSRPIPGSKDNRIRHSSTSSIVSVDQGYLSASPATCEMGPSVFSPPSHHHKSAFSFHNSHIQSIRGPNAFRIPSTSPLLEIPDDTSSLSPPFTASPASIEALPTSALGVVMPPLSLQQSVENETTVNDTNEVKRLFPKPSEQQTTNHRSEIQAMSALIDSLTRQNKATSNDLLKQHLHKIITDMQTQNHAASDQQLEQQRLEQAFAKLRFEQGQPNHNFPANTPIFSQLPSNSLSLASGHLEHYQQENGLKNSWLNIMQQANDVAVAQDQRNVSMTNRILLAQRQKELQKLEIDKFILNMMSEAESKAQVFSFPGNRSRHNSHTEMRLVPMRSTAFSKRYDFSLFENVLPRKHINPYHIKMEGEGYGSDDLRNFILSSLSKAKCAQMNCVVCGVDMPVYDHFPLVDGTMFLSPEINERSTRNCFKIKVEGKCEYVHAACTRCLEGLHNIVCRLCNARWEGGHYQLGTLYMYDIFAALPCCQKRLSCKQCGGAVVDIRQGLTYFSDYSLQKACPRCHAMDFHFVRPVTTYQLIGLVFS